jgi:hypothetical protein
MKLKPSLLEFAAISAIAANRPLYIVGAPGGGKTSIARAVGHKLNLWVIEFPPAPTIDPIDLRGAMKVLTKADCAEFGIAEHFIGTTYFFPPDFLPRTCPEGFDGILLSIDDIPTATQAVQSALFQLFLEGKLGNYSLPPNTHIIATGNRVQDKAGAGRLLTALGNRVVTIELDVDENDWLAWAAKADLAPEVRAYIKFRHIQGQSVLNDFDPSRETNPTPRSWHMVSDFLKTKPHPQVELALYAGCVGEGPATEFRGFLDTYRTMPDPEICLSKPKSAPVHNLGQATTIALCGALSKMVELDTFENFLTYVSRFPAPEHMILAVQDATILKPELKETRAYIDWKISHKALMGAGN